MKTANGQKFSKFGVHMEPIEFSFPDLVEFTNNASYLTHGDTVEKESRILIRRFFPNSENFWKKFIVPNTNRILREEDRENQEIWARRNSDEVLQEIGSYHYSVFRNFVEAEKARYDNPIRFDHFYIHLASSIDAAEEFLLRVFSVVMECNNEKYPIYDRQTKLEFLEWAGNWFDNSYEENYVSYISKGKSASIKFPHKTELVKLYLSNSALWKKFARITQLIRTYRNHLIHHYQIAFLITPQGPFLPKKEKIKDYTKWSAFHNISMEQFSHDFAHAPTMMDTDMLELLLIFNEVWEIPISQMNQLFYVDHNSTLLAKYGLAFTS